MLNLNDNKNWNKLSGPFNNSGDIPGLLQELEKSFSKKILDEICSEYIYHQGSLYESTVATIPYLAEIAKKSQNTQFMWDTFLSVGIILSELDKEDAHLNSIFNRSSLTPSLIEEIKLSYKKAYTAFAEMGKDFLNNFPYEKDDDEKIYFLASLATFTGLYLLAQRLILSANNDEYAAECLECDAELYFENEAGKLVLYMQDPVFHKEQETVEIKIAAVHVPGIPDENDPKAWFNYYVNYLRITSVAPLLPYMSGSFKCAACNREEEVFTTLVGFPEEPVERVKWTRADN